jgi:3,4-dihydroxy 2-butanone 4-phosphate synthase/GTP cyclohydrolase II
MSTPLEQWLQEQAVLRESRSEAARPSVTLAYAQSLDGSIAARRGQPLALSGDEALHLTHHLRSLHDGILVGIGTVLADNPHLTVRLAEGPSPQPIILDSRLRTPLQANILSHPKLPWIAALPGAAGMRLSALHQAGARVLAFDAGLDGRIPLEALLAKLAALGIRRLMVEGGAQVITSFLAQGLVDWLVLTIAPVIIGGLQAVERRAARRLEVAHSQRLGADLVVWGKLA